MKITRLPGNDRPRERLLQKGAQSLTDAELLAVILRTGGARRDALELAHALLEEFSGLSQLLDTNVTTLSTINGLGPSKCAQLKASLEIARRYLEGRLRKGKVLTSSRQTRDFLAARLKGYPHEVFSCLFLDCRHRMICFEELFSGTVDAAQVHPREVVRRALMHNAAAVILCHNHPSGIAEPSQEDKALTRKLRDVLSIIDVRVLDHIVIGDGQTTSFSERGLL